ncbi:MAG: hypothetical protein SVR08_16060 [Spirochaetota bacterium]|nr:hypothetical protein [Spirochaetota bacterium]
MDNIKVIQKILETPKYDRKISDIEKLSKNTKSKGKWYKQFDNKKKKKGVRHD